MNPSIDFSQYGDVIEARLRNGISPGCELIRWSKEMVWNILAQSMSRHHIAIESVTTNDRILLESLLDVRSIDEFLRMVDTWEITLLGFNVGDGFIPSPASQKESL